MWFSRYEFPTVVLMFLGDLDLIEAACINRHVSRNATLRLNERRRVVAKSCMEFFYFEHFNLFCIDRSLYRNWIPRVRQLFHLLPEFFAFMGNIRSLDLGFIRRPHPPIWRDNDVHMRSAARSVLSFLRTNRVLHYCDIRILSPYLERGDVEEALRDHPMLTILPFDKGVPASFYRKDV